MSGFVRYECAEELFAKNNCIGYENCIFIARKDNTVQGLKAGLSGTMGLVGAWAGDMVGSSDALQHLYYDALLINQTEKGIGFIPLWNKGIAFSSNLSKLEAKEDNYFFIDFGAIEKITIKNFNVFNHKMKKVRLFLHNGGKIQVLVRMKEKSVPYHEMNFDKFIKKHK